MPLNCDCYPGCWADHSEGWPSIEVPFDKPGNAVRIARLADLPRGSYVIMGNVLRVETTDYLSTVRNAMGLPPKDTRVAALTFAEVTRVNLARCERWHPGGIADWTPERWMTATEGELGELGEAVIHLMLFTAIKAKLGEAGNALKKLFRVEDDIANINAVGRDIRSREEAVAFIAKEAADTFLYLNLLCCRLGIDLPTAVAETFNATSVKYGFPERLP